MTQSRTKDHLAFVKELADYMLQAQSRPGLSAEERGRHARWLEHATGLKSLLQPASTKIPDGPHPADQDDLPPALLKELRRSDQLEHQIVSVLQACNGVADLDEVLIGLYRGFGVIGKRRVIQNKLWRLVRTGRIGKAKDKRNVFSLHLKQAEGARRGKRARTAGRGATPSRQRKVERQRKS
ncbi:MAG: hypothetical protein JOY77_14285 [Alphaproteobacteria bacterium]|nr:hypothetical protein [Alphaproteobacteria bacterium]MBV9064076.1 hypothetical protein [Alphaproteobacteria bacterium]